MRVFNETRRYDARATRDFRNLITRVSDGTHRPAAPRTIERPPHFLARRARGDSRLERACRAQHAQAEGAEAHALDSARAPNGVDGRGRQLRAVDLHLHDDPGVAVSREHAFERRHVGARQIVRRPLGDRTAQRCRAIERAIVMDDDDAVAGQMHVELETVGAERQAVVECGDGVFGRQRAAASMREHQRV